MRFGHTMPFGAQVLSRGGVRFALWAPQSELCLDGAGTPLSRPLYLIRQALAFRRAGAALYRDGDSKPIDVAGPLAEHVSAVGRTLGEEAALTLVPRLLARRGVDGPRLGRDWWGSETGAPLPGGIGARFRNVFTDGRVEVRDSALALGDVFASFPVALLARED